MFEIIKEAPSSFYLEEERNDYVVSSKMKHVWAIQIDLVQKLLQVCEKHNIKVLASGGTMLGAVRHGGMIPWDDDIDMMMYREDYNRLCEVAKDEFIHPYFFQTEYTDPGALRGHAQLRNSQTTAILRSENKGYKFNQGIFIDIFPLDAVIDDEKLFMKQYKDSQKYRLLASRLSTLSYRYCKNVDGGFKNKIVNILHPVANFIIRKFKLEQKAYAKFEKICQRYNNVDTKMVSTLVLEFTTRRHFKYRKDYENIIYVPFEYIQLPIGSEYDHALTQEYGDYMKMVKGTSVHGEIIFDVEKSYKEYI